MGLTILEQIAVIATGLATVALAALTWLIYIQQRPRITVEIVDETGVKDRAFYFYRVENPGCGSRVFIFVCLEVNITQYGTSSILSNMHFKIPGIEEGIVIMRITHLIPRDPFRLPWNYPLLSHFIEKADSRDLLSKRMYDYEFKGNGIWRLIAFTNTEDVFDPSLTTLPEGSFSLSVGRQSFGPYCLKSRNLTPY